MNLKNLRVDKGETQTELAEILNVSMRTVQNYEQGKVTIPNEKLKIISNHYNVSISQIFEYSAKSDNVDLNKVDIDKISHFVIDNWDKVMENPMFKLHFKAKSAEWFLFKQKESLMEHKKKAKK